MGKDLFTRQNNILILVILQKIKSRLPITLVHNFPKGKSNFPMVWHDFHNVPRHGGAFTPGIENASQYRYRSKFIFIHTF